MDDQLRERLLHICTWCMKPIPKGEELFAYGVKANNKIDLSGKEGEFVSLNLAFKEKTVIAIVTTQTSKARKQGFDLIFLTCSQACAEELKNALNSEQFLFNS
jgi:hypothetical protein